MLGLAGMFVSPGSQAASIPMSARDADILTRTIYGEAVGESGIGQAAVACVVFNRVNNTSALFRRDVSVAQACLRHGQFSCWRSGKLHRLDTSRAPAADLRNLAWLSWHRWQQGIDPSCGATHFARIGEHLPWMRQARQTARIGHHVFYSL